MTQKEKDAMHKIVDAHNIFVDISKEHTQHPDDMTEWIHHIHALQRILMARDAVRNHPELFSLGHKPI